MAVLPMMYGYPEDISIVIESMREAGKKAIEDGGALAKKAHVQADTAIIDGHGQVVSDAILEQAKKFGADLIVMGTHGRRGLNRLLLGSDAERVLRSAQVPVLLVKGNGAEGRRAKGRGARNTKRH
jgi:nucleotide-binding universal stress UspA family protein